MKALSTISLITLLLGGCARDARVPAVNLQTGEERSFSSNTTIPAGWAACTDGDCSSLPPEIPCQNIGADVCERQPTCTKQSDRCLPPPPDPASSCSKLSDENSCRQQRQCDWQPTPCPAMPCAPDQKDCPPKCSGGVCVEAQQVSCEHLDKLDCDNRSDCDWTPVACPGCAPGANCPPCTTPFCTAKNVNPPHPCPDLAPPGPEFCKDGTRPVPEYGADGRCVIGFTCQAPCPTIPVPSCQGRLIEERDPLSGCVVNYRCENACGVVPRPACANAVPIHDSAGCVSGYKCPATLTCSDIQTAYGRALADAKQCTPGVKTYQCQTIVQSSLACGCPTAVNVTQQQAIAELTRLKTEWDNAGCGTTLLCAPVRCFVPPGADCKGTSAGTGVCADRQP
ncbi:MAG: hypothetical protein H6707_17715 [Deltaproteobacteria bacterium]|nr:hypothetical protein [Deltaproteobacteria bacterium]